MALQVPPPAQSERIALTLQHLLNQVQKGELTAAEAWQVLSATSAPAQVNPASQEIGVQNIGSQHHPLAYQDLGFARLDHDRAERTGFPEVIFAEGKQSEHLLTLCRAHLQHHDTLLVTRLSPAQYDFLTPHLPFSLPCGQPAACYYNDKARTLRIQNANRQEGVTGLVVVCAGTADLNVAEEIIECALAMGQAPELICDVGVAGLHRLLAELPRVRAARVLTVVAGMEGALPSVVAGLVGVPVIAVPTSIGYGTGLGGVAALMSMLNSCAAGMVVVNIDNGFGAARFASLINLG